MKKERVSDGEADVVEAADEAVEETCNDPDDDDYIPTGKETSESCKLSVHRSVLMFYFEGMFSFKS